MTAKEIHNKLTSSLDEFYAYCDEVSAKQAKYEHEQQDLLHYLEFENLDAVAMVKVAKQLKDVRAKRRNMKVELDQVNAIKARIGLKGLNGLGKLDSVKCKTYTYRTNICDKIKHNKTN